MHYHAMRYDNFDCTEWYGAEESNSHVATINILPDDIFREIFAICLSDPYENPLVCMWEWQGLVKVCQRWRQIIYASPRYFDLHLCLTNGTSFMEDSDLSLWPEFPLIVNYYVKEDDDDVIAALGHPDRTCRINLSIASSEVFDAVEAMEVPFPVLTHLELTGHEEDRVKEMLYLSDRFWAEYLGFQFTGRDRWIRRTGRVDQAQNLSIRFAVPYERWSSPMRPQSCAVLPALTEFVFRGGSEYLDEFMAQIDTPRVEDARIEYSELDEVQAPQFSEFVKRSQFRRAQVDFYDLDIELDRPQGECHQAHHSFKISDFRFQGFTALDMARVLSQLVPMLSNVAHLSVLGEYGVDDMLPLLRLFPAVEVDGSLEGIAEDMVTEVFPALQLLLLDGDDNKLEGFLSLRRLSGHPVTIVNTQDEFVERLNARWENV
ncbi:hypothetical protein EDB84DRAFT_1598505 [Lactarius hengduanensis]|nr:hypothetical protein EDB84DRAFT_1598505 [Lactarius hengduanensis]